VPPSTARNAFVMATDILLSSNGTTVPLRFITRICPGAVAAMRVWLGVPVIGGVADAGLLTDSLPVCILSSPLTRLFVGLQPVHHEVFFIVLLTTYWGCVVFWTQDRAV